MEKPHQIHADNKQEDSTLRVVVEQAKWGAEPVLTIEGATFVLQPVEDLTQKLSPERVEQFIQNYKAAEDPANRFNEEQAMERFRRRRTERQRG